MRNLHVWHAGYRSIFVRLYLGKKQCLTLAVYFNIPNGNFWPSYPLKIESQILMILFQTYKRRTSIRQRAEDVSMFISEYEGVLYVRRRPSEGGRERGGNPTVRELHQKGFIQVSSPLSSFKEQGRGTFNQFLIFSIKLIKLTILCLCCWEPSTNSIQRLTVKC